MNIAIGDGASPRESSEVQAQRAESGRARDPITLRWGPLQFGIPLGVIPAPLLSLLLGAAVSTYTVLSFSDSELVQTLVARLQVPKVSLDVKDATTGDVLWPERKSYVVRPGQVLRIQLQPGTPPFWVSIVTEGYGTLTPPNGLATEVYYTAPQLPDGVFVRAGSITICTGDPTDPDKATCGMPIIITTRTDKQ